MTCKYIAISTLFACLALPAHAQTIPHYNVREPESSVKEVISVEPEKKIEPSMPEDRVSNTPESQWMAHEFEVVHDEDTSFSNRLRRIIHIIAPTALTREDRIATLMEAALQAWQKHHSQAIAMFLLPFESAGGGIHIARLDYVSDACGWSGEECTGKVWTDAYASDVIITEEQKQVYTAWISNEDNFKEIDADGFEDVNEDRLKAFLAEQFGTTPDDIHKLIWAARLEPITSRVEISIPDQLALRGHLSEQDQEIADEAACRASLSCWGEKYHLKATSACRPMVERLAKYDFEWTDTWTEVKFPRFMWGNIGQGTVKYMGDKVKFQNRFGAWQHMFYWCTYNPDSGRAKVEIQTRG